MKNKTALFLWFLLCWGIVVGTEYPIINQPILKGLIPFIFAIMFISQKHTVLKNRALNNYIIFFLWCSLSIFYTVNMPMTLGYLQTMLGIIIIWYTIYRLTLHIENLSYALLILGGTFLFHAIQGMIIPVEIIGKESFGRATGAFTNANALGFSMWYGIVIFLFLLLTSTQKTYKILIFLILVLFVWVLLATGSRKNVFGLVIFLAVVIYYLSKGKFRWGPLIILILTYFFYSYLLGFVEGTAVGERLQQDSLQRGATNRTNLVGEGLSFFLLYPILGIGLGSFTSFSSSGLMSHNDYIEILSSTGLIGLFLYIPIFWRFFNDNSKLLKHKNTFKLGVVAKAFIIGYLFLGLGRPAFLDPVAMLVFGFFQSIVLKKINYSEPHNIQEYAHLSNH